MFMSLTFAHSIVDPFDELIDDAMKAWTTFNSGRFKSIKKRWGIVDFIRSLETTHSWANGLHPHHHGALLTERPIGQDADDPDELLDLQAELYEAWSAALATVGRDRSPRHRRRRRTHPRRGGDRGLHLQDRT